MAWARALAALHGATLDAREPFHAALDQRAGEVPIAAHAMPVFLSDAAAALEARCASLGVDVAKDAFVALRELSERLGDREHAALTPADTCPDNNIANGAQLVLVDFAEAEFRHIAWDVAYLHVPWPSCWCSWRLPDDVAQRAYEAYREALVPRLSYVGTDRFSRDVAAAAVGWALVSASWFLPSALAELAARLGAALREQWGDVPLPYAPAFPLSDVSRRRVTTNAPSLIMRMRHSTGH